MTYYDSEYMKINGITETDPMNECENIVAYRVPEDAETVVYYMLNQNNDVITVKAADNVFGGKDLVLNCERGYHSLYLDANTYIQRSGEHKGCILIENSSGVYNSCMLILKN